MGPVFLLLRIVHILSALTWYGGALTAALFILPTARRLGPDGSRFMQDFAAESGFTVAMMIAGWLTVIAGGIMFAFVSGGFNHDWLRSPTGITLSIGALFGISAVVHGAVANGRTADKLAGVSREIAAAGGPPTPEQVTRLIALREKLARGAIVGVVLMTCAATAMAIARYV
jgi:hypothetical protein